MKIKYPMTMPTPTVAGHAATKGYVDGLIPSGFTVAAVNTLGPRATPTVTLNGTAFTFGIPRAARWFTGSGAPVEATLTAQGALVGDMYLDTDAGTVYELS